MISWQFTRAPLVSINTDIKIQVARHRKLSVVDSHRGVPIIVLPRIRLLIIPCTNHARRKRVMGLGELARQLKMECIRADRGNS